MANLTIIACVGKNRGIGKDNELIYHFKEDMKFFKEHTMGKKMIMGRKTLESLPKLLPGRTHLVLTHSKIDNPEITTFSSIEEFLDYANKNDEEIMVIGGARIYSELYPYSNKMLLTEVDDEKEADAFFPEYSKDEWDSEVLSEHTGSGIKYKHLQYKRK